MRGHRDENVERIPDFSNHTPGNNEYYFLRMERRSGRYICPSLGCVDSRGEGDKGSMRYTKKQLLQAMYLFMDDALPKFECEIYRKNGSVDCTRCDDCMIEQYLKKAKSGERCKKDRNKGA